MPVIEEVLDLKLGQDYFQPARLRIRIVRPSIVRPDAISSEDPL
jgi:hypothetical protein